MFDRLMCLWLDAMTAAGFTSARWWAQQQPQVVRQERVER